MVRVKKGDVWVKLDNGERFLVRRVYKNRARVLSLSAGVSVLVHRMTIELSWMKEVVS